MENKGFPDTAVGRNFAPEKQLSPTDRQEMKIVRKSDGRPSLSLLNG
ncbi:hypothetical protein [Tannerella forsythia]|nr:hypothetical protein [Tannerella forsythia]